MNNRSTMALLILGMTSAPVFAQEVQPEALHQSIVSLIKQFADNGMLSKEDSEKLLQEAEQSVSVNVSVPSGITTEELVAPNGASAKEAAAKEASVKEAAAKDAAEQRALAEIAEANAAAVRYEKEAEGALAINAAENTRNDASRRSAIYENLVKNLPEIIRETVKPMENIESIKILQVDGVPGINSPSERSGGAGGVIEGGGNDGNMTDRVVNSAMKYRTQVAFVDGLMKDLGLPINQLGSAGGMSFRNFAEPEKPVDGAPPAPRKKSKDDD